MSNTLATVQNLKESLSKEIAKGNDNLSTESCQDILGRLNECEMSMIILSKSLIGTVVSKLKHHDTLGGQAKALVKKWKKIAKEASASTTSASSAASTTSDNNNNKVKQERRTSTASAASTGSHNNDPTEEWVDLEPQRQTICQKLHSFLGCHKKALVKSGINKTAIDHLLISRASEVERALYDKLYISDKKGYADKARSLCFNLKKNVQLSEQVILGQVSASELIQMSTEQLASAEARKAREETSKKLIDSKRLDWDQANEEKINEMCGIKGDLLQASLFTCGRCKSVKTTSTQKQTRSADEPMTVFVVSFIQ